MSLILNKRLFITSNLNVLTDHSHYLSLQSLFLNTVMKRRQDKRKKLFYVSSVKLLSCRLLPTVISPSQFCFCAGVCGTCS
jgi:hypothetical protein